MTNKTIYIEVDEEITSIIDRLAESETKSVTLVVPKGAKLFQSAVNLKFLKKEAEGFGKNVTVVTTDPAALLLAQKVGLPVKERLEFGQDLTPPLSGWPQEKEYHHRPVKVYDIVGPGNFAARPASLLKSKSPFRRPADETGKKSETLVEEVKEELQAPPQEQEVELRSVVSAAPSAAGTLSSHARQPQKALSEEKEGAEKGPSKRIIMEEWLAGVEEPMFAEEKEPQLSPFLRGREIGEEFVPKKKTWFAAKFLRRLPLLGRPKTVAPSPPADGGGGDGRAPSRSLKLLTLFIAVALIITAFSFYIILPAAKVAIVPKKEKSILDVAVVVDKNVSQVSIEKIPGQLVQIEKPFEREFPATGKKTVSEKAKGTVTVYNAFSSSPQTLVATTRFLSKTGKLFRLVASTTIPGASVEDGKIIPNAVDVEVVADQPGDEFNIGPSDFTIPGFQGTPKFAGFYGKSTSAMAGGLTGEFRVVSKEDLEKAKDAVRQEIEGGARQELLSKIPADLKFIAGAEEERVSEIIASREVGAKAETFTLKAKLTLRALLFKESDLETLADQVIGAKISADQTLTPESRKLSYGKPELNVTQGWMKLSVSVEQEIMGKIDSAALKEKLAGKNETEIRGIISQEKGVESATVTFWPFWVSSAPRSSGKIQVIIQPR